MGQASGIWIGGEGQTVPEEQQEQLDLQGLRSELRQPVKTLGELLLELAGENLRSLVIFGLAVTDQFDPKKMRIQSVAVLERMDLGMLNVLRMRGIKLGKQGLQAPLIMTPQYIDASRDVFPIELLEIQQLHVLVYGTDLFADLQFGRADMRLQCERELKRGLIQLRQGLLAAATRDKVLTEVALAAAEHAVRVLRAILWLKQRACPAGPAETVDAAESALEMKLRGLRAALVAEIPTDFAAFEALYNDVESLARWVDEFKV
ncbi:MAG: hypothetical protein ACE5K7_04435 [Phycisphaerae bacterium]